MCSISVFVCDCVTARPLTDLSTDRFFLLFPSRLSPFSSGLCTAKVGSLRPTVSPHFFAQVPNFLFFNLGLNVFSLTLYVITPRKRKKMHYGLSEHISKGHVLFFFNSNINVIYVFRWTCML